MRDPWSVDERLERQREFDESTYVPRFPKTGPKPQKNAVRKVSAKTKAEVLARDGRCVCCSTTQDLEWVPHHAYYGGEANYGPGRNDPDQLVTICRGCHRTIHFESDPHDFRKKCKDYLVSIYGPGANT